ncbi:MAG: NADP-dependent malic enzyme [Deltaproteobacteria bacterium]|nr:MAG: NADP-dependent malic enzyme [Deltaproteobacteria bacterium]
MVRSDEALRYHTRGGRPGKIEVVPTKPLVTQRDLSLAYSPGVAEPCLAIAADPEKSYDYTARGNLVAVITNGTAVLGLGDIGALASKPVMEGKGCLFKKFADIDVFDIEIAETDPDKFVDIVAALEPTFGGINLEDIAAPASFEIERKLRERMTIPVFHDDQHGTAIITGAALINACDLTGRALADCRVVVSGAGASAIACAHFMVELGVDRRNIVLVDSKGVIYEGREGVNEYKAAFAGPDTGARSLADAMAGADVFLGLSRGGLVTQDMVRSMADRPIVFALANPDPEIPYADAMAARDDVIVATGRSDHPNQVNNVLGFPYIFRGALDVRATQINEAMKIACAKALAALARENVEDTVIDAYGGQPLQYGPLYLIPKPFDPRVLWWVAPAVARAAVESGVARLTIDPDEYAERLRRKHGGVGYAVMRNVVESAREQPKRIAFPEASNPKVLRACERVLEEGIAVPILLGRAEDIDRTASDVGLTELLGRVEVIDPVRSPRYDDYCERLYQRRQRKGMTLPAAQAMLRRSNAFGCMMVAEGDADGIVSGLKLSYRDTIRPALQIIGPQPGVRRITGMYMMVMKDRVKFIADATINIDPDVDTLVESALLVADAVRSFGITPRVALVSFSNFGSHPHPRAQKVRDALAAIRERRPELEVEGEMQADFAVDKAMLDELYPFHELSGDANVLIFPSLEAANASYKLLAKLGGATAVGPVLLGMAKPVTVLAREMSVEAIVNATAYTVKRAQEAEPLTPHLALKDSDL